MTREDVDRWLDAYVEAWATCDHEGILALFSDDVEYRFRPSDQPVRGRDAVAKVWLGEAAHEGASARDEPGTYEAVYRAVAVDGDAAVATGATTYWTEPGGPVDKVYDNCFVMRFDSEGRCREFTEWYMLRPS